MDYFRTGGQTMIYPPVRRDNTRALANELSPIQAISQIHYLQSISHFALKQIILVTFLQNVILTVNNVIAISQIHYL